MNVLVYSITYNRLFYTKHCFEVLRHKAGMPYIHIVIDNGSTDGTQDWLKKYNYTCILNDKNIGVTNAQIQMARRIPENIDYLIKMDNDCEIVTDDIIKKVMAFYEKYPNNYVVPRCNGLMNPPPVIGETKIGDYDILLTPIVGGIFSVMSVKDFIALVNHHIKNNERLTDPSICDYFRSKGYVIGYFKDIEVNHFETTAGQHKRYPEYFKWENRKEYSY